MSNGKSNGHDNITPIKPGESRNPKGWSKKAKVNYLFRKWLQENKPEFHKEAYELICGKVKQARDFRYMQEFLDRTEGKVPQKTELTGKDGGDLELKVSVMSADAKALINDLKKQLAK